MSEDIGKIAVIAGIMGALLLFGLLMNQTEPVAETTPVVEPAPAAEVTVIAQETLEMLDPVYSEKAVYNDRTIRIAFEGAYTEDGVDSRLPFWLHNVSGDVINILWDRCSMQLPGGNTVSVVNENASDLTAPVGRTISIAPAGDLFDAFIPVTEIEWTDEGATLTNGVLDQGTFTLVLAIERAAQPAAAAMRQQAAAQRAAAACEPGEAEGILLQTLALGNGREIAYYTFRLVIR